MSIMISIPAGIAANQSASQQLTGDLSNTITAAEAQVNQTLTQIDVSLTPSAPQGFGFGGGNLNLGMIPGGDNFAPGQFGGGFARGMFGAGAFGGGSRNPMNESYYSDLSTIAHVAAVAPILTVSEGHNTTITGRNGITFVRMVPDYTIQGIPLVSSLVENYRILPQNITAGRNLQSAESGSVLISANNSAYFGVGVGNTIDILGKSFTVVGIHGSTGVSDQLTLYMNLSDAQSLTNNLGYITSLQVFADSSDTVSAVAADISSLHGELDVTTSQQRLSTLQAMQANNGERLQIAESTMNQIQTQAFQEIVIAVVATSLIVMFVMLYTVRERTKEIGTLKAIGFSNWNVMSQFMLEGVILSLFAGVIGVIMGTVAAPFLSSVLLPRVNPFGNLGFGGGFGNPIAATTEVIVDPQLMLIAFGGSILLGALGSLYPAWRASRTRPAEAMRYE